MRTAKVFGKSMHVIIQESMSAEFVSAEPAKVSIQHEDIRAIAPSLEDVFVTLTNNRNGGKQ